MERVGAAARALCEKETVDAASEGGGGRGACGEGRGGGSLVVRWMRELAVGECMARYEVADGYPGGVERPRPVGDFGESVERSEAEFENEGDGRALAEGFGSVGRLFWLAEAVRSDEADR